MGTRRFTSFLFVAIAPLAGCAAATGGGGAKGAEDNELVEGKLDSFYRPTDHGSLSWGIPTRATISSDEQFHAWTFTLGDSSRFALETQSPIALDTVMYLYHRTDPDASWGRYVAKNDDASDDQVTSRLERRDAPAGEYRVIVKGYKAAHRGDFALLGTCDGPGCGTGTECSPDAFPAFEDGIGYSASCNEPFLRVLLSPRISETTEEIEDDQKCMLPPLAVRTLELYQGYWDSVLGWEEWSDTGFDEPLRFEVSTSTHELGSVVAVSMPVHDEDQIVATYDASGALIVFYVYGQSDDLHWYCGRADEELDSSGPSCTHDLVQALPHSADEVTRDSGTTTHDRAAEDLPPVLEMSIGEFVYGFDVPEGSEIDYEAASWRNADTGLLGGQVTYRAGDAEATYTMVTSFGEHLLIGATTTGDTTAIGCLELM